MCHQGQCEDESLRVALTVRRVLGLPHTIVGPLETPLGISAFQTPEAVGSMSRASQCSPDLDSDVFLWWERGSWFQRLRSLWLAGGLDLVPLSLER